MQQSVSMILYYANKAGFTGRNLVVATAIALAESGGNDQAYNPEIAAGTPTGEGSYGLWQIYSKAHPEFSKDDLLDPQKNAQAAFKVFTHAHGTFTDWSTFKNLSFIDKLAAVTAVLHP